MPVLARNAIAFLVAVAIYVGGFRATGYILTLFDVDVGFRAFLLYQCAFGVVGYFLFGGNSRAVLVLFASIISALALNVVAPDPVAAPDPRNGMVQVFVWISMGVLAAITTNLTGWVVERIKNSRSGPTTEEAKETERLARRESSLTYRLGTWVGRRLHSSGREK